MSDKPREYLLANHPNEDTEWLEAMEKQRELERLQSLSHTPGPWQMGDGFSVDDQCTIIGNLDDEGGNGHTVICDVNEDPDAYYANARLIAAAPDLYEALRLLVADVADYPAWQRPCHALDAARAALAKAVPNVSLQATHKGEEA